MTAVVLDGVATASAVKSELAVRIRALREQGLVPGLGTLLVGDDPGSRSYVAGKHRDCAEVGIESIRVDLPADATEADVRLAIERLNSDPAVTGYIVQLPLPAGIDENAMLELIDPSKDADGLHPTNLGRLVLGVQGELTSPLPCTPAGIVEMLQRYEVPIAGQHVVVVGRGLTVGRPLGLLLTRKGLDATVTLTHSRTRDLEQEVRRADIVVAAVRCRAPHQAGVGQAGRRGARRRHHACRGSRDREGAPHGRRGSGCRRGRRPPVAEPARGRADDPRDAARPRGAGRRARRAPGRRAPRLTTLAATALDSSVRR